MKRWPELRERLFTLAGTLRGHGVVWHPFVETGAEVRRGSRIPDGVVAEMRGLLEDLRAVARARPAAEEVADFVARCRELARRHPDRSADFEALAARSEQERTAHWEECELLLAEESGSPVWGTIRFVEGGRRGEDEVSLFPNIPLSESLDPRSMAAERGYMGLWMLLASRYDRDRFLGAPSSSSSSM